MSIFTLYLLFTVVPGLDGALTIFAVCSVLASIGLGVGVLTAFDDEKEILYTWIKGTILFFVALTIVGIFVPNKDQILTIAGGYAVTNDAEMKKLPDNILKAANAYLEKVNETNKK